MYAIIRFNLLAGCYTMLKVITDIANSIARHHYVEKIMLFGSRARGDHLERADIDIAVFCSAATREQWLQIWEALDDFDTLYKIDLVRFEESNQTLQSKILTEGIVLYERK